jgi:hypothetical protein
MFGGGNRTGESELEGLDLEQLLVVGPHLPPPIGIRGEARALELDPALQRREARVWRPRWLGKDKWSGADRNLESPKVSGAREPTTRGPNWIMLLFNMIINYLIYAYYCSLVGEIGKQGTRAQVCVAPPVDGGGVIGGVGHHIFHQNSWKSVIWIEDWFKFKF